MTNIIHNVPRELLERAWRALANSATGREIGAYLDADPCAPECAETCARASMCATCSADLSAQSPAGVDGLEVVGYVSQDDIKWHGDCTLRLKPYSDYVIPLCRLSSAQAIIDGLRGEVAELRRRAKTAEREAGSALRTYKGLEKVARVVSDNSDQVCGELNVLRQQFNQQAQRVGELTAALELISNTDPDDGTAWFHEIADAALSASKEQE